MAGTAGRGSGGGGTFRGGAEQNAGQLVRIREKHVEGFVEDLGGDRNVVIANGDHGGTEPFLDERGAYPLAGVDETAPVGDCEVQASCVEFHELTACRGVGAVQFDGQIDPSWTGGQGGLQKVRAVGGEHEGDVDVLGDPFDLVHQLEQEGLAVGAGDRAFLGNEVYVFETTTAGARSRAMAHEVAMAAKPVPERTMTVASPSRAAR